ncbi:MAG TPA: hypothetical protein VF693_06865 [Allosphingosinicella sp.]|jgi:hypothetical protein
MADIIPFRPPQFAWGHIGDYLRVGETGHHQLEAIFEEGKLRTNRAIFDANSHSHQKDLARRFRERGAEITLDPKTAELAAAAKYQGRVSSTPWAEGLDTPTRFWERLDEVCRRVAQMAIEEGFHRVIAPSHFLREGAADSWLEIDIEAFRRTRRYLDELGGTRIALDYGLILTRDDLLDEAVRGSIVAAIFDLPFSNLFVRISRFGADASPPQIRRVITALAGFHNLGRAVVLDYVGGLTAHAALAFGAASGLARGLGNQERFDASDWQKFPQPRSADDQNSGPAKRVRIFGLDRSLTIPELMSLAKARNGHRLVVCSDRDCCHRGLEGMVADRKGHYAVQEAKLLRELESVPEPKRTEHFLSHELAIADRTARQIKDIKPLESELKPRKGQTATQAAQKLTERLVAWARRNEKTRSVLENLHEVHEIERSRVPSVDTHPSVKSVKANGF